MLAARYRLEERIAVGGMGSVFVATDERLGRRVAVKLLKDELAGETDFVERFRREARAAARLNHPHIAQVYDHGEDDGRHFIVMELVEGTDLARLLEQRGRLASEDAVRIASQVCSALSAAHAAGIVHRDIKPANVIVGPDGRVKVTDFGIARTLGQTALTHTGTVMGTAQYLPPEQARGEPATAASDVYSLGVVLFQMLTGSVPFTGDSPVAVALRHLHETVPAPSDFAPDVPPGLDSVVARATAKDPSERFADAAQMADALAHASHVPATAPLPKTRRRAPAWVAGGLLLVAAAVLAVVLTIGTDDTAPSTSQPTAPATTSGADTAASDDRTASPGPSDAPSGSSDSPPDRFTGTSSGPVVPAAVVGADSKTVEERFKARGYEVEKADIPSAASKDSVVATLPRPGQPLTSGQTLVLLVSKGEPAEGDSSYRVPSDLVGADAHDVEEALKGRDVHVTKISVDSATEKDRVLSTYPTAGTRTTGGELVLLVSSGHPPD